MHLLHAMDDSMQEQLAQSRQDQEDLMDSLNTSNAQASSFYPHQCHVPSLAEQVFISLNRRSAELERLCICHFVWAQGMPRDCDCFFVCFEAVLAWHETTITKLGLSARTETYALSAQLSASSTHWRGIGYKSGGKAGDAARAFLPPRTAEGCCRGAGSDSNSKHVTYLK